MKNVDPVLVLFALIVIGVFSIGIVGIVQGEQTERARIHHKLEERCWELTKNPNCARWDDDK